MSFESSFSPGMMVLPTSRSSAYASSTLTHQQSQRAKSFATPLISPSRAVPSVGCSMPSGTRLRSPAVQDDVRAPSPNYFGLIISSEDIPRDSDAGPKDNRSPPISSTRSFGRSSPKHIAVDANSNFEDFRRQTVAKNSFNLGHGNLSHFSSTRSTSKSDVTGGASASRSSSINDPADAPPGFGPPRQDFPLSMGEGAELHHGERNSLSHLDDRHPRMSLPLNRVGAASPPLRHLQIHHRSETLRSALEDGPIMIPCSQLKDMLGSPLTNQFLLLDLRVAPQYSHCRIRGALNLCIPTTLLKRPSFNLAKLAETFKIDEEKTIFSTWKESESIVVYDGRSTEWKDAISAVNTLKKFINEGWEGRPLILRGGMQEFSRSYPNLIDYRSTGAVQSAPSHLSFTSAVAPVAGGCEFPRLKSAANPFFNNIRQNIDLVGGVGQIDVKRPDGTRPQDDGFLPAWLRKAAAPDDHGKTVAARFLKIEQAELSRMQQALSSPVSYGTPVPDPENHIQIAGFEKGVKNRYNNIWPFEHARVRLQGLPEGACDYVNASHIKASWSSKRYIASQGPLPATFEDFWSVIWDQDVRVIVMLTAESEGGQLKCHPYWTAKQYGNFKLKALSERRVSLDMQKPHRSTTKQDTGRRRAYTNSEFAAAHTPTNEPYVVVRKFTLSRSSEPFTPMREVTQLQYSSWPDFGAPAQPIHLLVLIELSSTIQREVLSHTSGSHIKAEDPENLPHMNPLLVHCSAGCGRTGTFCAVDSIIDVLKRQRKWHKSAVIPVNPTKIGDSECIAKGNRSGTEDGEWAFNEEIDLVQKTVEDFRKQRISMVQTLRQYVLCYETVWEWISQQRVGGRRERSGSESRPADNRSS